MKNKNQVLQLSPDENEYSPDAEHSSMIPVGEFKSLGIEQNSQFRVLKPWWDVLSEYLCIAMLMIGVFGCTLQLTQDKIACLPSHMKNEAVDCNYIIDYSSNNSDNPIVTEMFGRKNNLDIHQYLFVNQYCYERFVHWYAKYFPYLVVIHSMIFMVASSFWFKFPGTSSKIDLFVNILRKCFDSPWTTRALSEVSEERGEEKLVSLRMSTMSKDFKNHREDDEEENIGLLRSTSVKSNSEKKVQDPQPTPSVLDKKEGEQAKALFEKVKKFRTHVEEADILYLMYVLQTSLKVFKFLIIIVYTAVLVQNIEVIVHCDVPPDLTGFQIYCCNHTKANLFSKLAYCYICFIGVYGLICIYTLYWVFHRPLKEYSFEHIRLETGVNDIPDVKNDFAFLLHLVDQYDALYPKRFAVFLSEVSESHLYQLNLNHEWTNKKLRAHLSKNSKDKLELCLTGLAGLPDTVFEITEIESLKLEQVKNVTIPAGVAKLDSLQELSLIYCAAKLQLLALNHLKEHLKVLRLTFESSEEIPMWMYALHCLEELFLTGPLNNEVSKSGNLESLRDLSTLRLLSLRSNLRKIPPSVGDLASQLQALHIHNEGVKLQAFSTLKKLTNLVSLELSGCELERIPSAVFSLNNLQELDLKENKLCTVEEILSLQHCRRLVTLRLWHNKITYIPDHITKLHTLETLDISWNKLKKLPSRLFYCTRLRHLDISHNQITSIPSEVNILSGLQFFSAAFNSLESLPEELFSCKRIKTLVLSNNCLSYLSPKVGNLAHLVRLDIKGNRLDSLPLEIGECPLLRCTGLIVEDSLFDLLPSYLQKKLSQG